MGIGKSIEVNVIFNHSNSFYYAGEKVCGSISFNNTKKKITLNDVTIGFTGEFGYSTQETYEVPDSIGYVQTENRTVHHQLPFVNIHLPLMHMKDSKGKINLHQGQNSWPFEFTLPETLPPSSSSSQGSYPYIKYYMYIVVDQTRYKSNKHQHIYPLTIFPNVNIFNANKVKKAISASQKNHKKMQLTANLKQQFILPGQNISFNINLDNPKRLGIKRIQATLIQHRYVAQHEHSEVISRIDLPIEENFNETELHDTIDLNVPNGHLLPTHFSIAQLSTLSIRTNINYELTLEVQVNEPFSDINLSIPIVVGTKSSSEQSQFKQYNLMEKSISYAAAINEIDLPPAYEAAMEHDRLLQRVV